MTQWIPWWIGAYLLGSVPFGLLIGLARGVDIRTRGSGNIGATNVLRTLGKPAGVLAFTLDFLKGFAPTLAAGLATRSIARADLPPEQAWAWLAVPALAIIGHMFPLFLRFRGGKGVATGFGALLAVFPWLTLPAAVSLPVWFAALRLSRFVSVASCAAAASLPLSVIAVGFVGAQLGRWPVRSVWPFLIVAVVLAALVLWKHRGNLARVRAGTEPRLGAPPQPGG
jgi:glycerol-3-phosphate acyltransferase PlsY